MCDEQQDRGRPRANELDYKIGVEVRSRRILVGMSQGSLGDALGVSFQQVQKYEKGTNRISASRLRQIAAALDVPVTYFYDAAEGVNGAQVLDGADGHAADPARGAQGARLMRAFERVENALVRQRVIALIESFADSR